MAVCLGLMYENDMLIMRDIYMQNLMKYMIIHL